MKRKPLVKVPVNGDIDAQIAFEDEMGFVKAHYFYDHINLVRTLKQNKIVYHKNGLERLGNSIGLEDKGLRLLDHYYIASDKNGKLYFVAEPYIGEPFMNSPHNGPNYVYEETVSSVAKWCRKNSLDLQIRQPGQHCKCTTTTLFIISNQEKGSE